MALTQLIFTEHLTRILQEMVMKHRTGLLSIEHVAEKGKEHGEVYFDMGEVTIARTGREVGVAALAAIQQWEQVYYTFYDDATIPLHRVIENPAAIQTSSSGTGQHRRLSSSLPPVLAMQGVPRSTRPLTLVPATPQPQATLPKVALPRTTQPQATPPQITPPEATLSEATQPAVTLPPTVQPQTIRPQATQPEVTLPRKVQPQTIRPQSARPQPIAEPMQLVGPRDPVSPGVDAIFRAIPKVATCATMYSLERRERIIFALLDGRRTLRDVSRLTHQTEVGVARVLAKLMTYGYIEHLRG